MVTTALGGALSLVGEVKWSEQPFDNDALEDLARQTLARPLPPGLSGNALRAVFVPRSLSGMVATRNGVRVVDANAVLRALL